MVVPALPCFVPDVLGVDQAFGLRFMNISASSELAATSAVAVTYSFFPDPWEIVLEFQRVETTAVGGSGHQLHNGPLSWTGLVVAPRYRFSPFSMPALKRVNPLIGAGVGFYTIEHSLSPRGRQALINLACVTGCAEAPAEKLTNTVGIHAEAGLDFTLFWGWSLSVEGRWLSLTPDIIVTRTPQVIGADIQTSQETLSIQRAAQYFTIFNALLRYRF